jgi:DNA-binding PadR family transcriptional regulator
MSVKLGLLALLAEEPMYGARLRAEFEARTGGTWPLNVGQVYTTLSRLERDGLVEAVGEDAEGRIAYRLTSTGRAEVAQWWLSPVDRDSTPRDELVIKLALAVTVEGVDVPRVVQTQRTATLKHLQDLTRLKHRATGGTDTDSYDIAWLLVLENLIYTAEAEVRWLDHVEARLAREATRPRRRAAGIPGGGSGAQGRTTTPGDTTNEKQQSSTRA